MAAANGQYLLINRDTYKAIGEHASVRNSLLEDVGLACAVKRIGKIRFRYGPEIVSARMYRSLADLIAGWTKNLAALFPNTLWLGTLRTFEFLILFFGPPATLALIAKFFLLWGLLLGALTLMTYIKFANRLQNTGRPLSKNPWSIIGLALFAYVLFRSSFMYSFRKSVTWKGRSYATRS
jgi:hypothetical protein